MARKKTISKHIILDAGIKLISRDGFESLNARKLAD